VSAESAAAPEYEGLWRRFVAALVDNLFWIFAWAFFVGGVVVPFKGQPEVIGLIVLGYLTIWFNYFAITEWRFGQTIGKNAMNMRVVKEDGSALSYNDAALRNVLRLVDFFVVGWVMIANSPRHQRLGDRAAHTVVISDRKHESPPVAVPVSVPAPPPPPPPEAQPAAPPAGERPGGLSDGDWGPLQVLFGVLALIGLALVETLLVVPFDPGLKTLGGKLVLQGLLAFTLVGVAFSFAGRPRFRWAPAAWLGLRRFKWSALGWAAAALGMYFALAIVINLLTSTKQEDIARDLGLGGSTFGAITAGVLIIGAAPVSEEVFFRGFMFGGIRNRLSFLPAALIAGGVFGLFHFGPGNLAAVVQLAGLGFILCWLYEKTGSIWPTILIHALNNTLAFILLASK
jgi:membrane protease YdiL (CAAX protease family)/uncharacterized RDD family membrane protein YckC